MIFVQCVGICNYYSQLIIKDHISILAARFDCWPIPDQCRQDAELPEDKDLLGEEVGTFETA